VNIQIFGKPRCFDTKKAERYFKERGIKYQSVDILRYGMSKGEYTGVKAAVGGYEALIDEKSSAYKELYIQYLASGAEEKLLENPALFKTPVVRNGKAATVGFAPDVWAEWK